MRNPIERTWSHALMEFKREGRDWKNPSTDDLADFAARTKVVKKCEYLGALETWNKFYPSERISIGFLEDINYRPRVLLKGAYGFLGVRSNFKPPNIGKKENSRGRNTLIPTDVAKLLAVRYTPELEKLAQVFGGYTSFWLHCAKKLSSGEFADEGLIKPRWCFRRSGTTGAPSRRQTSQKTPANFS